MQREEELAKLFKQYNDYLDTLLGLNEPSWIGIDLLKFRSNLRKEQGECNGTRYGWCRNFKGFIPYRYFIDNNLTF